MDEPNQHLHPPSPRWVAIGVAVAIVVYVTTFRNMRVGNGEFGVCVGALAIALGVTLLHGDGSEASLRRQCLTDTMIDWVTKRVDAVSRTLDEHSFHTSSVSSEAKSTLCALYDVASALVELVFGRN